MTSDNPDLGPVLFRAIVESFRSVSDLRSFLKLHMRKPRISDSRDLNVRAIETAARAVVKWAAESGLSKELGAALVRHRPVYRFDDLRRALYGTSSPIETISQLLLDNRCILFAGAGVSNFSGMPTWRELLNQLVSRASAQGLIVDGEKVIQAIDAGEPDFAMDLIQELIGIEKIQSFLLEALNWNAPLHPIHLVLGSLPFVAAFTSNWDRLLERAFSTRKGPVLAWDSASEASDCLADLKFFVLKLSGDLERQETVLLHRRALEQTIARDKALGELVKNVLASRTMVFVGASPETIESFLRFSTLQGSQDSRHFAFVGKNYTPGWESRASSLSKYYGVELIPYETGEDLVSLLEQLPHSGRVMEPHGLGAPPVLRRALFQNVGPFDHLEIRFESGWNVLLGNNGVGKSSILRALAVALSGEASEPWADRVIKMGKDEAYVTVETSHFAHRVSIFRREDGSGAEVRCSPAGPMGRTLKLGFPPLRTGSWRRSDLPQAEAQPFPVADDMLPLVIGEADPRLDKVKEWIVKIDHRIKDAKTEGKDHLPFESLLNDFFEVVQRVTEGVPIRYGGVNPETRQVSVITAEGKVPIELVSQGTASLISWVGVLLQRLYDIHGSEEPRMKSALVLIDEIDAHMHPAWQQSIIHHLQEKFPNIQVIATTHSPLIVAGRKGQEVTVFSRDPETGVVSAKRPKMDFKGMRSDQILTSPAFGLEGARDYDTTKTQSRYRYLLEKIDPTAEELAELDRLNEDEAIVATRIGETPIESETIEVLSESLDDALTRRSPEERAMLLREIDLQVKEAQFQSLNR